MVSAVWLRSPAVQSCTGLLRNNFLMYNGHRCFPSDNCGLRNKQHNSSSWGHLKCFSHTPEPCPVATGSSDPARGCDGNHQQAPSVPDMRQQAESKRKGVRKPEVVMQRYESQHLGHSDSLSRGFIFFLFVAWEQTFKVLFKSKLLHACTHTHPVQKSLLLTPQCVFRLVSY